MNVLIVFAHPESHSFNGAMFEAAVRSLEAAGHTVATSDLYRMGFDPVSSRANFTTVKEPGYLKLQAEEMHATDNAGFCADLEAEMRKLEACDLLIVQFPMWWFGVPAILKGWFDRVLAMGRTYGNGAIYGSGKLRGKRALLSLTTGGPQEAYAKGGFNGDIASILRGVFEFLGFDVLAPQIHYGPVRATPEQRQEWLAGYAQRLQSIEQEAAIAVGQY